MNNDTVIMQLDRPRQIKFTHTSLKAFSSMIGKSIEEIDSDLDVSNFEFIEQMVYCGLLYDAKQNGETLTLEQIPDLLDRAPYFSYNIEKAVEAWRAAFGAPTKSEGNEMQRGEPPENPSTGKSQNE